MNGYLVPPVWLPPIIAPPPTRVWWPVPGNPPPNMEACLNCRQWHTLQQYGGPGRFDWMRVCPSCGYWWRVRT